MSRYKVEISGINTAQLKVLTNAEMKELFVKSQQGDESAKETSINGNLKLVLFIMQHFSNRCENMDDLFQVGYTGLVRSIDNFSLKREVCFSTYAVPVVMGEIRRYLRDNQVIRVSRHLKDLVYRAFKLKEKYVHKHQKEPSISWLAQQLKVKEKDIVDALDSTQSVLSIFEPVYNSDGGELFLLDQIKGDKDGIERLNNLMALKRSLTRLKGKGPDIIQERYYQGMMQTEIAGELGISQAQVSRPEKNAITVLKKESDSQATPAGEGHILKQVIELKYMDIYGRQVTNVMDGSMIGLVNDVESDPCTYMAHSIFVHPTQSFVKKLFPWFFPRDEIEIPTQEIESTAGDVVPVKFRCRSFFTKRRAFETVCGICTNFMKNPLL